MSQSTSFIPPNVIPPEPPGAKTIAFIFSAILTLVMLAFVGFIVVDFTAEMAGYPIGFAENKPTQEGSLLEQYLDEEFKEPFELVAPKDQTQLRGPGVVVIYTERTKPTALPGLWIDGVQHHWNMQYGENTWYVQLQLPTGKHHVQAGKAEAEFFVAAPDLAIRSPELWLWSRPHLGTNDVDGCVDCHEMPDKPGDFLTAERRRTIGEWKGASSCFASECHDAEQHEIDHRFVLLPGERSLRCIRCHTATIH